MKRVVLFIALLSVAFAGMAQKSTDVLKQMKNDLGYLASDQLEGRLTGSSGELRSSLYIADLFKQFKISPKGNDSGSYFQTFSIIKMRISQGQSVMLWTEKDEKKYGLKSNKGEFYPLAQSCNKDSINEMDVYQAGYGITAPEFNYNDYTDTNGIRGKVFVIRLGSPESGNAHGRFEPYESITYKVDQAIKRGARGVVLVNVNPTIEAPKGQLDRTIKPRSIPVVYANGLQSSILNAKSISFSVNIVQINATAHNVIGMIDNHQAKTIVIGAHQDHLGYNEFGGSREPKSGQIHNGADDNASGVSMMLALAKHLKKNKKMRQHNYVFIAFSGEEQGLLGSNHFVKHPSIDLQSVMYMLNYDMVGRLDSIKKTLMVYGVGTSPNWKTALSQIKTDSTQIKIKTTESGTGSSDHTSFYYANIPVLHFFTGQHHDYHTPLDDENKINYSGMLQVYQVSLDVMKQLNNSNDMPFTATKSEESEKMSFKVTLGIMPDYIYDGVGLRVDGVNLGKPGEKAGLLKGDIIVKMGEYSISNIQDYMKSLGQFKKGQTTSIEVKRNGETKTLEVTF